MMENSYINSKGWKLAFTDSELRDVLITHMMNGIDQVIEGKKDEYKSEFLGTSDAQSYLEKLNWGYGDPTYDKRDVTFTYVYGEKEYTLYSNYQLGGFSFSFEGLIEK